MSKQTDEINYLQCIPFNQESEYFLPSKKIYDKLSSSKH